MAGDASSSLQAIITQSTCHVMGLILLYYDHILEIESEIQYMWRWPRSFAAVIFFLLRYGAGLSNIPIVVYSFAPLSDAGWVISSSFRWSTQNFRCSALNLSHQILLICTQVLVSIIMIQRTSALYGHNKLIIRGLCGTAAVLMALIIWLMQDQTLIPLYDFPGCHIDLSRKTSLKLAGAWGALFLFDGVVFALTILNAYFTRKRLGKHARMDMPIHALIVRDGALYFGVIALANLANILTFVVDGPWMPGSLTIFTTSISITMVCRLMLNVHEMANVDPTEFNLSAMLNGMSIFDIDSPPSNATVALDSDVPLEAGI
ncbi:hypothetical protein R3P38DRAFT_2874107 [Favolaschia claudopus]|uniref:DUF6533 domain-containing protein n=1 Tax=Favolaschia claudopus TaxID=2862362 RepID=A0AAW0D4K3_9AGAR